MRRRSNMSLSNIASSNIHLKNTSKLHLNATSTHRKATSRVETCHNHRPIMARTTPHLLKILSTASIRTDMETSKPLSSSSRLNAQSGMIFGQACW